jgi:hypothetical protein
VRTSLDVACQHTVHTADFLLVLVVTPYAVNPFLKEFSHDKAQKRTKMKQAFLCFFVAIQASKRFTALRGTPPGDGSTTP